MKVCKVVVNSVSHDARVLKEAAVVRDAGMDVVIIGIQDANNATPIEILANGVVIRRVPWQSEAFRPPLIEVFVKLAAVLAVAAMVLLFGEQALQSLAEWLSGERAAFAVLVAAVFAALAFAVFQVLNTFRRRLKNYYLLKRVEDDELLKYESIFREHRAPPSAPARVLPEIVRRSSLLRRLGARSRGAAADDRRSWRSYLPRPLMRGLVRAFTIDQLKRWKAVFAREKSIRRFLHEEQPSIVHAHDLTALPVAAKYARARGAKLVFDAHEIYAHLAQVEDETDDLNHLLLQKYCGAVDRFITINDSIARYYRNNHPALPPAIVVKNAARLAEPAAYDGRLHEAAGLPRERRILIYQGGYAAKRGLVQLLMSAQYLSSDWSLVYMGWGRLEDELRRVAYGLTLKDPTLADRIRFVPRVPQEQLPLWSCGASLGAIPYENSGLNHWFCTPNKLWEYPNAGVPIIASPFPELTAVVEGNGMGWRLPDPLNPESIAALVNRLSAEELAAAATNCRRFIRADNWEVYAARVRELYGELQCEA